MMNLKELFEMQKKLDEHIVKEKGLEGQDLLPQKILALQVELGELANEWRGFKFWSNNQEPRTKVSLTAWGEPYRNPLLEEYVDCLHFLLSIGNVIGTEKVLRFIKDRIPPQAGESIVKQFEAVFYLTTQIESGYYVLLFNQFIALSEMLGFTEEQIVQAYKEKNQVNHKRQENGY